jgi:cytoplasmic iron level regulating protein YaaA (DUF328/UPF0246 family)
MMDTKRSLADIKPCIYAFSGAAYQGLQASSMSESAMLYLQDNLRIIDPLYGVLRPLDAIQPYRLEMATRHVFPDNTTLKLSSWWQPSVTARLSRDLRDRKDMILLNLASDEYSAAVDVENLPESTRFVKVVFWEEGRVIAVHAKRARGLMVRYLAEHEVESVEDIKAFDVEGYSFVEESSDKTMLVFDRKKGAKAKDKPVAKRRRVSKYHSVYP